MFLPLLLIGCDGDTPKESVPDDDSGFVYRDTAATETGDSVPDDTDDSVPDETAETADIDTSETGDTGIVEPPWAALAVWPASLTVHPGATWTLRVVGEDPTGVEGDLPDDRGTPVYTSDDPAVATVDAAGLVTAIAEGATTLRVAIGGLEATASVTVRADGVATVTVLDGLTGLPVADARVALPFTESVRTDASGIALLPVVDGGPLTFSVWVDDTYDALTVVGVVGRELTLSVLPKDTEPRSASLEGTIDFSSVDDAGWSDIVVGFASGSIQGSLAATRLEDLFAADRDISVFGVETNAPANLFIEGSVDTYAATALPGSVALFGLAGPIAIADATSGLSGSGDALRLLADNLGVMSWGYLAGLTAAAGSATSADLAPADRFDDRTAVSLPPLSAGFAGDEEYFVLVTEERPDEGFVVTGLGTGTQASTVDIASVLAGTVSDSLGTTVLAYGQVGGVGSGGPVSTAIGTVNASGDIQVPLLQDIALVDSWEPTARGFGFTVDAKADFVRVRLRDERNRVHDIITPGSWSGSIPNCVANFRLASSEIEILAVESSAGAYESWIATGDVDPGTKPALTAARTTQE